MLDMAIMGVWNCKALTTQYVLFHALNSPNHALARRLVWVNAEIVLCWFNNKLWLKVSIVV